MKVYLSHPFGGREENRDHAARIAEGLRRVWKIDGQAVELVNPLESLREYDGRTSDDIILLAAVRMMKKCDGVIFAPGWKKSRGCRLEHIVARAHDIPRILLDQETVEALA